MLTINLTSRNLNQDTLDETPQWTMIDRVILPIKIVPVGSEANPATAADIEAVMEALAEVANEPPKRKTGMIRRNIYEEKELLIAT